MNTEMSYEEAINYVLEFKKTVYGFSPEIKSGKIVGGFVYIINFEELDLEFDDEPEDEKECLCFDYVGGRFNDSFGEMESYRIDDVEDDAKSLKYRPANLTTSEFYYDYELQIILKILCGLSLDESKNDYSCPECDQIIFKTGKPNKCERCKKQ